MADNSVFLYNLEVGDKFTTTKDRNKVFVITGRKGDTTYVKEVDTGKETWFGIPDAFVVPVNEEAPQQCKDSREPNYMDDPEYGKVQTREIYTESKKLRKSHKSLKEEVIVIHHPWGEEIKDYKAGDPIPAGTKFKIFKTRDQKAIDAWIDSLYESTKKLNEAYYIKKDKKYFCNMNGSPAWGPIKDLAIPFNSEQEARDYMKKFDYLLDTDKSPIIVKESKKVVEGLAKGSLSRRPITMNTLVESVNLSNEDDLYDWMMKYMEKNRKKGSTSLQFITDNGNSIIISWNMKLYNGIGIDGKKMNLGEFCLHRMKGVGIQDVWEVDMNTGRFKPVKESLSSKTHKFRPEELKVGKRVIDKIGGREVHGRITVNHHDLYKDNPYRQDGKGSTVVTITTDSGRSYDVDANDNGGEFILEGCIKESSYYIKSPGGFYLYKRKFGYDLTDNKEQALKWDNNRDATHEMRYVKKYSPDIRFRKLDVVQEEGEAPAVANTTANVANPELPLKLKEATKVPYLLKNAKVGDTFHDGSDLGREYKITRVTPSKVYATCIKDPNVTGEYNKSHPDYNETDSQWAKLYTIKEEKKMRTFKQYLTESILKTQNEGWGFFGTITMEFDHNSYEKAKEAWKIAFVEVQRATGWTDVEVREWLDSRDGRHFADQCADFGVANDMRDGISQAAKFWKERKWFK